MVELAALVTFSGAKVAGNPLYMLFIGFFYVMAAQSIGLLLYTFTSNALMAYSMIGMLVSIAMAFSGMAVPELSMILPARIISNLEPLTHALNAMFDIFLREVSLLHILYVCALLLIYPVANAFLSVTGYRNGWHCREVRYETLFPDVPESPAGNAGKTDVDAAGGFTVCDERCMSGRSCGICLSP